MNMTDSTTVTVLAYGLAALQALVLWATACDSRFIVTGRVATPTTAKRVVWGLIASSTTLALLYAFYLFCTPNYNGANSDFYTTLPSWWYAAVLVIEAIVWVISLALTIQPSQPLAVNPTVQPHMSSRERVGQS